MYEAPDKRAAKVDSKPTKIRQCSKNQPFDVIRKDTSSSVSVNKRQENLKQLVGKILKNKSCKQKLSFGESEKESSEKVLFNKSKPVNQITKKHVIKIKK